MSAIPPSSVARMPAAADGRSSLLERYINVIGPIAVIVLLCLVMAVLEPSRYFRIDNMWVILHDASYVMCLAMAMTLIIVGRGIDLSIGSIAALTSVCMAFLIKSYGFNVWIAMLLAVAMGTLCGLVNGLIITRLRVPDLIGTLAMDLAYRGLALVLAAGLVLARFPEPVLFFGRGDLPGGIPFPVVIGLGTLALGAVIYHRTPLGRYLIAIGGNEEAAVQTGIPIERYKIYSYMLMGTMAAVAGIMITGRLNAAQATTAQFINLHTIAAVVVGGTSLFGGRGSMLGSFCGVLLLSMMTNALITLRIEFFWQQVAAGAVIIGSVGFYSYLRNRQSDGIAPLDLTLVKRAATLALATAALLLVGWLTASTGSGDGVFR